MTKHHANSWTSTVHVMLAVIMVLATCGSAAAMERDPLDLEFQFASGLVELGFADFAEKVVEQELKRHPDHKDRTQLISAEIMISRGRFDEAKALVDQMPADSPKAQAITLALAGAYYRRNEIEEAQKVYEDFFKQYKGRVPADEDLKRFYQDAAYQHGQLLEKAGDISGALQAYGRVLATNPDRTVQRKLMADQASLYVTLAEKEGDLRWLDSAKDLCNQIQWGGLDIFFGQSIITMARAEIVRGDEAAARKMIMSNIDILKEIDNVVKQQDALLKESPMAGARFLLAELYQQSGEQFAKKNKKEEAIRDLGKALTEYYNVFAKYGESDWGGEAGIRAKEIQQVLENDFGKTVKIDLGEHEDKAAATQFRLADNLFQEGKYQEALEEYLRIYNEFPASADAPDALINVAKCYAKMDNKLYLKAIIGFLGERFSDNKRAPMGLLGIAKQFFDKQDEEMYTYLYEQYLAHYPKHPRAPAIMYTLAGLAKKRGDEDKAVEYYDRLVETYPNDQYYIKALSRLAWDTYLAKKYEKAIPAFEKYIATAQPGFEKAQAQFCLADAQKQLDDYTAALSSFGTLVKWLDDEESRFNASIEDRSKNADLLERSMFYIGYCYAKAKEPKESIPQFRDKGIKFYQLFIRRYPDSDLAPAAMNGMGTMQLELGDFAGAVSTFDSLAAKYPQSSEGKSAVFSLIRSAMEVEQYDVAKDALNKMMGRADQYTPAEFSRVGQLMLDDGLYTEALTAFRQVKGKTEEREHLERALYGIGTAYFEMNNYEKAINSLEELMTRYPKSGLFYEAKFLLGNAYRETGRLEEAMLAISDVSKFAEDVDTINRASYVLAQIQKEQGELSSALASYQRVALLTDPKDESQRPIVEKCILESIETSMEIGRYDVTMDSCDQYLKLFPDSEKINEIRKTRADAKLKQATAEVSVPDQEQETAGGL